MLLAAGCGSDAVILGAPGTDDLSSAVTAAEGPSTPLDTAAGETATLDSVAPLTCGDQNGGGDQHVDFEAIRAEKVAAKPEVMARHQALLDERYDQEDDPSDVTMPRGKPFKRLRRPWRKKPCGCWPWRGAT